MITQTAFVPDIWLVLFHPAFESLAGYWSREAGQQALLPLRIQHQFVRHISAEKLTDELVRLANTEANTVRIVVDEIDKGMAAYLDELDPIIVKKLHLRVCEWRIAPLETVTAINGPDSILLKQLQSPAIQKEGKRLATKSKQIPVWWPEYERALKYWEQQARAVYGNAVHNALSEWGKKPIPWADLAFGVLPVGRGNLFENWWRKLLARSPIATASPLWSHLKTLSGPYWQIPAGAAAILVLILISNVVLIPEQQQIALRNSKFGVQMGTIEEPGTAFVVASDPYSICMEVQRQLEALGSTDVQIKQREPDGCWVSGFSSEKASALIPQRLAQLGIHVKKSLNYQIEVQKRISILKWLIGKYFSQNLD